MTNFSSAEIRDLIGEVGEKIELGIPRLVQSANPTYGLSERTERTWRVVIGYVFEDNQSEIATAQGPATESTGGLRVILEASKVTREELNNADARIRYQGNEYQFQYLAGIRDRGVLQLHKIQLI